MKRHLYLLSGTALAVLLTTALTLKTGPVLAQQDGAEQAGTVIEEIVVTAKPIAHRSVKRTDASGKITETLTLERHISYDDLDLSKDADVTELKKRIDINAKEACHELDDLYPIPRMSSSEMLVCIRRAIDSAKEGLEAAVAAAR